MWESSSATPGPPSGPAGGDLAGTYPNPTVIALEETGGPTRLVLGAIADGQALGRSGGTVIGVDRKTMLSGWGNQQSGADTLARYLTYGILNTTAISPVEANGQILVGCGCTFNALSYGQSSANGGISQTITGRINGVDTALTFVVGVGVVSGSDTTHTVNAARGDLVGIKVVASGTNAQATTPRGAFRYSPT